MYDTGVGKRKLPDLAPDPFRERETLVRNILARVQERPGFRGKTVAITDEFVLKNMFPFIVTFLHELGFQPVAHAGGVQRHLKKGIEQAHVPYCAPLQLYYGVVGDL